MKLKSAMSSVHHDFSLNYLIISSLTGTHFLILGKFQSDELIQCIIILQNEVLLTLSTVLLLFLLLLLMLLGYISVLARQFKLQ